MFSALTTLLLYLPLHWSHPVRREEGRLYMLLLGWIANAIALCALLTNWWTLHKDRRRIDEPRA